MLILAFLSLGSQALFIFGGGTLNLCRPIRKGRLWMPTVIAALMFGLLAGGLALALSELFYFEEFGGILFWVFLITNWLFWSLVFFFGTRRWQRMNVLNRLTGAIAGGSLIELLITVPSHMIVSRRPGCFVGLMTMSGILAGLYVMLFSFGPGIFLLFTRSRYRQEQISGPTLPRRPWYQFTLRKVFAVMLIICVVSAWLAFELQDARSRQPAANEITRISTEIDRLGGTADYTYETYPDSLGNLLGDPGVFYIEGVKGRTNFDDTGLSYLKRLPHLSSLSLRGTQVTGGGLKHLEGMTTLLDLDLTGTNVTDARLKHLSQLTSLQSLNLRNTQITDAGLENLKGLTGLRSLDLRGTQITDAGAKQLLVAVPELSDGLTWTPSTPK